MKEKVHEEDRKAAETLWIILYAISNDCTLQIHPWQDEHQQRIYDLWSCILGNQSGNWLRTYLNEVLAACTGKGVNNFRLYNSGKWRFIWLWLDII